MSTSRSLNIFYKKIQNKINVADEPTLMPEIQFIFLKPWLRSRNQRLSLDRSRIRSGSDQTWKQNHLKFTDSEPKLTLVHVTRRWSRNLNRRSILLEDGIKVATGMLSRSRSSIRACICKPPIRSQLKTSRSELVLVPDPSMIQDLPASIFAS